MLIHGAIFDQIPHAAWTGTGTIPAADAQGVIDHVFVFITDFSDSADGAYRANRRTDTAVATGATGRT